MAEIVAALGVPHTPMFPSLVTRLGPQCEIAKLYGEVAQQLAAVQPDVLVVFDSDHLNTFFLNNLPVFSVGVATHISGPNDGTPMPHYEVAVHDRLATHLRQGGIEAGFDLALAQDFTVDHSIMVPLHFLTPQMQTPVVPIFINGFVPPLPAAKRCFAFGEALRESIRRWPQGLRVAIVASGSFSLEVGGPRIKEGDVFGVPDPKWAKTVQKYLEQARIDELLEEATSDRMLQAGNVGGELLNWVTMLGVIGDRKPRFLEPQLEMGHCYGIWRWD